MASTPGGWSDTRARQNDYSDLPIPVHPGQYPYNHDNDFPIPLPQQDHELPIPVTPRASVTPINQNYRNSAFGQKVAISEDWDKEPIIVNGVPIPQIGSPIVPQPSPPPPVPTICGLRRRTFYIALAVAIVVLVGAIAGLVGGLVSQRNARGADNASPTSTESSSGDATSQATNPTPNPFSPSVASPILANSQLAAGQWSHVDDTPERTYVVYQDTASSIIFSAWDEQNTTWTSVNVTSRMLKANSPLQPRLGTPLALVTGNKFQINLYFMDTDNNIREIYTKDRTLQFWQTGDLTKTTGLAAGAQSRLAGYWIQCGASCKGSLQGADLTRIFFENAEPGIVRGYAGAKWRDIGLNHKARPGAGLATTPHLAANGDMHQRLFFDSGDKLGMMSWSNNTGWVDDDAFSGATHPTFSGQLMAATSFASTLGSTTAWAIVAVQLEKNGTLAATYWDPLSDTWTFGKSVELVGGPQPVPAFSAIAMNIARKFYGIADGALLEYRIDPANLARFVFTTSIPLLNSTSAV